MNTQTCILTWPESTDFVDINFVREGNEWSVELEFDNTFVEGAGVSPQDAIDNALACLLSTTHEV